MKLRLPKLLLAAVCAAGMYATAATEITKAESTYTDSELVLNETLTYTRSDVPLITWRITSDSTLSGTGSLVVEEGVSRVTLLIDCSATDEYMPAVEIDKGLTIQQVSLQAAHVNITSNNTWHNAYFASSEGVLDLTNATITGATVYMLDPFGGAIKRPIFDISNEGDGLMIRGGVSTNQQLGFTMMDGNVVLDGKGVAYGTEVDCQWGANGRVGSRNAKVMFSIHNRQVVSPDSGDAAVTYDKKYGTLNISGSLTVLSETTVVFSDETTTVDPETGMPVYKTDYILPDSGQPLIICSSVDSSALELLKPYALRSDVSFSPQGLPTGSFYSKPLTDYEFCARVGEKDQVYIYLVEGTGNSGEGGSTVEPPDFVVSPGETVVLGGTGGIPSVQNPVQMQGGVADATNLDSALLNNQVITGSSGVVQTSSAQTMRLSGSTSVDYSVVGASDGEAGAALEMSSTGNLKLTGANYDTARVSVSEGLVTVAEGARLGLGTGKTAVEIKSGASLTNFGVVAGDIELAGKSTMLNQGKVEGDISLQSNSTLVNNSTVSGAITVAPDALLSGSGSAQSLLLQRGASLNVGNSPGWQKYDSVTIERGSSLTFTVDGRTPASATNNGAGTHSVLVADALTIGDGAEPVQVTVNVTMGILADGAAQIELDLLKAETSNAKAEDFSITLNHNSLLDADSAVAWNASTKSLTLTGHVNYAAIARVMKATAANVANTMWASANAVQEMARVAGNQVVDGMPGKTTFWGAALGSFMDVCGFSSNMGGYAVGMQHAFTERFRMGVALGQTFGDFKSDDSHLKADQRALIPTLTAQYVTPLGMTSTLSLSGHVSFGSVENDADTYQGGVAGAADWDDEVLNVGVRAAWNKMLNERTSMSLFTGLTYQSVEQDSFTQTVGDSESRYCNGSLSKLSLPIGASLRGAYGVWGTQVIAPELTVAYVADIARDNPEVSRSMYGFDCVAQGADIGRNAFIMNAGANWMFNQNWSAGAFYTLEARSHQVNQSMNASLRYNF